MKKIAIKKGLIEGKERLKLHFECRGISEGIKKFPENNQ